MDALLPQSISVSELRIEVKLLMASVQASLFSGKVGLFLATMSLNNALADCRDLLSWKADNQLAQVTRDAIEAFHNFNNQDPEATEVAVARLLAFK